MIIVLATVAIRAEAQQGSDKLNEYCKAAEATGRFHGYVLVKQKGRVLLSSGFGYSDYTSKSKGTAQTRYQVGSVTKQFTASVILKLAEAGKLSLRDALSKYFPEFPNADKVTIEHLLTHTSGIYNYTNSRKAFDSLRGIASSRDEMMRMIAHYPYDFEPGTRWNYSNSAYSILGYIIEKVTGKPYERNVREMIFTPLGMTRSGFDYPSAAGPKATGYYLHPGTNSRESGKHRFHHIIFCRSNLYHSGRFVNLGRKHHLGQNIKSNLSQKRLDAADEQVWPRLVYRHNP